VVCVLEEKIVPESKDLKKTLAQNIRIVGESCLFKYYIKMKNTILAILLAFAIGSSGCTQDLPDNININTSPNGVVTLPSTVGSAWINGGFVKYTKIQAPNGQAIHFVAQNQLTEAQIVRARNILQFYLKNVTGSEFGTDKSSVANKMAENQAILLLLNGSDGQGNEPNVPGQPLFYNEIAVEGHDWYINNDFEHRDAAFEEILHLMHDTGIGVDGPNSQAGALPAYQAAIRAAQQHAHQNNFAIWPIGAGGTNSDVQNWYNELDNENSLSQEYLASVVDSYYGLWGPWEEAEGGMWGIYIAKTRAEILMRDPMGATVLEQYFSPYIDVNMSIDPSFSGTFSMSFDASQAYTHKSQYLQHCSLSGEKPSNLKGNKQYNRLNGNLSNNELEGLKGNDYLDGKAGMDRAKFTGKLSEYVIDHQAETTIISDMVNGRDGVDTLVNIETLSFADQDVSIITNLDALSFSNKITIFPNPADDYFMVKWDEVPSSTKMQEIRLYNASGRIIKVVNIDTSDKTARVDIPALTSGNYIVQLIGGHQRISKKISIQ